MLNVSIADLSSTDTEKLLRELREAIRLRDKMGGAMYWNMCNDDAYAIANRLLELGVARKIINPIMGI